MLQVTFPHALSRPTMGACLNTSDAKDGDAKSMDSSLALNPDASTD